jgi:hypothetical protein
LGHHVDRCAAGNCHVAVNERALGRASRPPANARLVRVITQVQTLAELQALCRGWGIVAPDLPNSLGPGLSALAGVRPLDDVTTARSRLTGLLEPEVNQLPSLLQICARAALALPPTPPERFLTRRLDRAAGTLDRDRRTVQRLVRDGLKQLTGSLGAVERLTGSPYAPDGWRVEALESTLWMTKDPPVVSEHRTIVATRQRLDRIKIGFSAPGVGGQGTPPLVHVTAGGTFEPDSALSTPSYVTGWLKLPRPLSAGQSHEYGLVVSGPSRAMMRPYYVFTPLWPCESFTLCAVFGREPRPRELWRVHGLPARRIDDFTPSAHILEPDSRGRCELSFSHLQVGLSYGIQWRW